MKHLTKKLFQSSLLMATTMSLLIGCNKPVETAETQQTDTDVLVEVAKETIEQNVIDPNLPTLKIATVDTYPPFSTTNEIGKSVGFDIDIMHAIAKKEGFNAEFVVHPWDEWETDLDEDKVDIWAAGITIKDKRKEVATYTDPYMSYKTAMLTMDSAESANITEANLSEYTIGAEANSTSLEIAQSINDDPEKVIPFDSTFLAFESMIQNKVNVVVGNNLVLGNLTTGYPDFNFRLTPLSNEITAEKQLGYLVKKDNIELANKLNHGLAEIKADGTYDEIKVKWFGEF